MTPKDIRDIAAYYGAKCDYTFHENTLENWVGIPETNLNYSVLRQLSIGAIKDFALHLRPITSLTDEEWSTGLSLLDAGENVTLTLRERNPHGMIDAGPLAIRFDGAVTTSYYISVTPLWAYLQSVGVYIPGTIDEKYVQLIP